MHNAALVFLKHHQRDCLDRLLSITVVKGFWNLQMGYIVSFQQDELDLYEAATGNFLKCHVHLVSKQHIAYTEKCI